MLFNPRRQTKDIRVTLGRKSIYLLEDGLEKQHELIWTVNENKAFASKLVRAVDSAPRKLNHAGELNDAVLFQERRRARQVKLYAGK